MPRSRTLRGAALFLVAAALAAAALALAAESPATAPARSAAAAEARPAGDAARGKKIYAVKCVACHKADGTGGIKLTGNPTPSWRDAKRWATLKIDDDYLRECIVEGRVKSGMIAWKAQLKPGEVEDLIAHIRTFQPKPK